MLKRQRLDRSAIPARGMSGVSPQQCCDPSAISAAVEKRVAVLAGNPVPYTLKRSSKRRSIGLRIDDRGLTVSMPLRAPESWLHSVLQDRAEWVVEKLHGWQMRRPQTLCWREGESIPYLGELLTLRVAEGLFAGPARQSGDELWVRGGGEARVEKQVTAWYRQQAMTLFAGRIAHYAPLLQVAPREVRLTTAKTRWGSCSTRGTVRLNLQLIRLPQYLIDYVVVHELAHLREMNHSAAFWAVVGSTCPDYLRLRSELKAISL